MIPTCIHSRVVLFALLIAWPQMGSAEPTTRPDDEQIQELIGSLRSNDYETRQAGIKRFVAIGEPAVPALLRIILDEPQGQGTFDAQCALRLMGAKAKPALPRLIALVQTRPASQPANAKNTGSPRMTALILMEGMGWAAQYLIPVLRKITEDPQEEDRVRTVAISALGHMGKDAIPLLRRYADSQDAAIRKTARAVLPGLLEAQGVQSRRDYFASLIEANLFDPNVPEYLHHLKTQINEGMHPLTRKVKDAYRMRLKERPDPEVALQLAKIIQRQLSNTDLEWAAPTDRGSGYWLREDPAENYVTLADILTIGFEHAQKTSDLRQTLGVALAKLRLLQGDWEEMNKTLTALGWSTIPAESRPFLAAPPSIWNEDLSKQWTSSDEKMRSGECGLVLHVEKDGKGVRGAHVLVKKWTPPGNVFSTGERTDTLFYQPQPLALFRNSFGYAGQDRVLTRYAVSDDTGQVSFEKLPQMDIQIELLAPTANFTETRRAWDLWMEIAPGEMKRAAIYGGEGGVDWNKPPAVVKLKPGQTIRYPRLVVLPQLELDVDDWSKADPRTFEIGWSELHSQPGEPLTYELEMILSGPGQAAMDADHIPAIETSRESLQTNRWPVGAKGVGGKKLRPGNIYAFGVVARDQKGRILSRSAKKCVWVPWEYRASDPPVTGTDTYKQSPIQVETWYLGSYGYGDGRSENLEEKVVRQLRESPNAFEREYIEVGKAWLDWHARHKSAAESELKRLVKDLPEGSVPHETAAWLLAQMQEGNSPPKRLKLVARANAPDSSPSQ